MSANTSANDRLTIGIDVGGSTIRAAVVDSDGVVVDSIRAPTPGSVPVLETTLHRTVRHLAERNDVSGVGVAIAGFVSADRRTVRFAPHLPWVNAPVADRLTDRFGLPVVLEHDANAAAWAEYRFGAAAGSRIAVVVALGTGIGAALLLDGRIFRGAHGIAPELGHLRVVPDGRPCACGKRGCWERYCSGTALVDIAVEMLAADPGRSQLAADAAADPGSLTGRRIAGAAHDGDALAVAAMAEFARWLGLGLSMVADVYDPELVVIGGGVSGSASLFLDDARDHYAAAATGAGHRPLARVRAAQLGDAAGLIGAALLAGELHTAG
ncbi:ROK family protein [Rhodococcus chondri]|uniref:ROK family protein n=1 Tax=Rhodococcus chondri TaxID=3065941 RepID=A0ABU7JNS3_9NOCA|nr:ROK family protein [Rhodococcus sp. CC-R104]MEE2031539.1 ROK family protein [Rhodococcus sp. CC-R104]